MQQDYFAMRISAVSRWLRRARRQFLHLARPKLSQLEVFVLDAVAAALGDADREAMRAQLQSLDLVQRSSGRLTVLYLDAPAHFPLFSFAAPDYCLARVKLSGRERSLNATVFAHRGRIFSIGFHGDPARIGDSGHRLESIALHVTDTDVSEAIDRLEHGNRT